MMQLPAGDTINYDIPNIATYELEPARFASVRQLNIQLPSQRKKHVFLNFTGAFFGTRNTCIFC